MPIPDRHKQRKEYLRHKTTTLSKFIGSLVTALLIPVLSIVCLRRLVDWMFQLNSLLLLCLLSCLFIIVICLPVGWFSQISGRSWREHRSIPYVPAIPPNSLPANEVLVRSSQEPEQEQSTVLLRAAENADTPAEELLRSATGEKTNS